MLGDSALSEFANGEALMLAVADKNILSRCKRVRAGVDHTYWPLEGKALDDLVSKQTKEKSRTKKVQPQASRTMTSQLYSKAD